MNEFDDKIRQALHAESENVWRGVEEQGLFEQALGVMRGQQKFISVMAYIIIVIFFGLMVYSIFRFFNAETTRLQIAWATGFLFANSAVAMMKMWFWMQMDKNALVREVKRLELQVATLAGIIKKQV
jgi:hypothetical protein